MKTLLTLILISSFAVLHAGNEELMGRVINVIDGNTIEVVHSNNEKQKLLLAGIDCPDQGQAYANEATQFLKSLLLDKEVRFEVVGKDRLANYLAIVKLGQGHDPRVKLLQEGLAWTSERDPLPELEVHRLKAQEKRKGLWKDENPTPPWTYRREQSMMEAKSN